MHLISIGAVDHVEGVRRLLEGERDALRREGASAALTEERRGEATFLEVALTGPGPAGEVEDLCGRLRRRVAEGLADLIVDEMEPRLLGRFLRQHYSYFDDEEQSLILAYADHHLDTRPDPARCPRLRRKAQVAERLHEYLAQCDRLHLEGFVTFRLKDYLDQLQDAVDRAVDAFLVEREYREFVRLLRYFVEAQEPRAGRVHVLIEEGGAFAILDEAGRPIESAALQEFVVEMVDAEFNYEDLLVSALITIAPRQVVVHCPPEALGAESLETVRNVFLERVSHCSGCELCRSGRRARRRRGH